MVVVVAAVASRVWIVEKEVLTRLGGLDDDDDNNAGLGLLVAMAVDASAEEAPTSSKSGISEGVERAPRIIGADLGLYAATALAVAAVILVVVEIAVILVVVEVAVVEKKKDGWSVAISAMAIDVDVV